jgi:hypothetical protein
MIARRSALAMPLTDHAVLPPAQDGIGIGIGIGIGVGVPRGTGHGARGTGHGARGTGHGARGTGHGARDETGLWARRGHRPFMPSVLAPCPAPTRHNSRLERTGPSASPISAVLCEAASFQSGPRGAPSLLSCLSETPPASPQVRLRIARSSPLSPTHLLSDQTGARQSGPTTTPPIPVSLEIHSIMAPHPPSIQLQRLAGW